MTDTTNMTENSIYSCYSLIFYDKDISYLKNTNKIIISRKILKKISIQSNTLNFPLFVKLSSLEQNNSVICSVHDFTDTDNIYVDNHIMEKLWIREGSSIHIEHIILGKGLWVKLKSYDSFKKVNIPQEYLEDYLFRNYNCLSVNDNVYIHFENEIHEFYVSEAQPLESISLNNSNIKIIIETNDAEPCANACAEPSANANDKKCKQPSNEEIRKLRLAYYCKLNKNK